MCNMHMYYVLFWLFVHSLSHKRLSFITKWGYYNCHWILWLFQKWELCIIIYTYTMKKYTQQCVNLHVNKK
jgi:hypothetical protein